MRLRLLVFTFVVTLISIVACSSDESSSSSSSGSSGTGCKEPGSTCGANAECCQQCKCTGSNFPVSFSGCSLASGAKICQTCQDFCGTKGVDTAGKCPSCS